MGAVADVHLHKADQASVPPVCARGLIRAGKVRAERALPPTPSRWRVFSSPDQALAGTFASQRALKFSFECLMSRSICRSMNTLSAMPPKNPPGKS